MIGIECVLIEALAETGLATIEVASFVNPKTCVSRGDTPVRDLEIDEA